MEELTIGQVAKQTQVNIETVRYYERRGLISEPPRRESGYRQYSPEVVRRIQFIKRAQELGFSLTEIGELLTLRVAPQLPCSEVKQRAETKIGDIERKIADLHRMKQALVKVTNTCTGQGPTSACPILDALDVHDDRHIVLE
jgi:MerR family transcriptional regulator, copper efflux regulator